MSIPTISSAVKPGSWDRPVPIPPSQEIVHGDVLHYQTLTFKYEYRAFSVEEHRLEDYKHGKTNSIANANAQSFVVPDLGLSARIPRVDRKKLQLLQGSGIEVHVSLSTSSNGSSEVRKFEKWSLPVNLISHYSPYLEAACLLHSRQGGNGPIEILGHDPTVFGVFVEWMYYGRYDVFSLASDSNIDVKCWILGDKLQSSVFQNHAMSRIYAQHVGVSFCRAVSCEDVRYVCNNTSPDSKLRKFYTNFVVGHFSNPRKLLGSWADWDAILQHQPEIRIQLLEKFRNNAFLRNYMGGLGEYLESNNPRSNPPLQQMRQPIHLPTRTKNDEAATISIGETSRDKDTRNEVAQSGQESPARLDSEPVVGPDGEMKGAGSKPEEVTSIVKVEKDREAGTCGIVDIKQSSLA